MRHTLVCGALLTAFVVGCGVNLDPAADGGKRRAASPVGGVTFDDPMAQGGGAASVAPPTIEAVDPAATPDPAAATVEPAGVAATETNQAPPVDPAAAIPAAETETVKAEAGVGKQGRYEGSGLIVTPIKAYFRAGQRIAFDNIAYNVKLYKATNDRFPKDYDEFKAEILDPLQVKLPELPAGHRYVYDAKSGELQVERPR